MKRCFGSTGAVQAVKDGTWVNGASRATSTEHRDKCHDILLPADSCGKLRTAAFIVIFRFSRKYGTAPQAPIPALGMRMLRLAGSSELERPSPIRSIHQRT